jgi:hypothetical protein
LNISFLPKTLWELWLVDYAGIELNWREGDVHLD